MNFILSNFTSSKFHLIIFINAIALIFFASCSSVNQLKYFNDLPDSTYVSLPHIDQQQRIIQKGDRLYITIGAKNPDAANIFNNYGEMPTSGGSAVASGGTAMTLSDIVGFWVDDIGNIEFPIIGKIKVDGMTTRELKDTITSRVRPFLLDPLVSVRFISFKFTVLGEVRAPGTYILSNQRTTLLDALGAAGDLPRSAKRDRIQIYRDYNGKRMVAKIDLRKKDVLLNPELFQLRNNDVIIVPPRDIYFFGEETRNYISLLSLLVTSAALFVTIAKK
jgi:polysaccharide export outer membrane protein